MTIYLWASLHGSENVQLEAEVQLESWKKSEVKEGHAGVQGSARFRAGRWSGIAGYKLDTLVCILQNKEGTNCWGVRSRCLWQSLVGTLCGISEKVRRIKRRMLWLTVKGDRHSNTWSESNPSHLGRPRSGSVHDERIYSLWAYQYSGQVPAKG